MNLAVPRVAPSSPSPKPAHAASEQQTPAAGHRLRRAKHVGGGNASGATSLPEVPLNSNCVHRQGGS